MVKNKKLETGQTQSFVPTVAQPMSMPNQSNVLGGRPPIVGGAARPSVNPAIQADQTLAGKEFIQNREKLVNQLKSLGHSDVGARNLANAFIAQQGDLAAGAQQDNLTGSTNQTTGQIGAGARGQMEQALVARIGNIEPQNPENLGGNIGGALAAGAGEAGVAALATTPLLATGAGAVGIPIAAAVGFIHGFVTKLRRDNNQGIQAEFSTLQSSKVAIKSIITEVNAGRLPYDEGIDLFNEQLAAVDKAESTIKKETGENLNKFLGIEGQVQLRKIRNFNSPGGLRQIYTTKLNEAILNPNPNMQLPFDSEDLMAMQQ